MKRILLSLCIFAFPLMGVTSDIALLRTAGGYNLSLNGMNHAVKSHDIDARLKSLNQGQLNG